MDTLNPVSDSTLSESALPALFQSANQSSMQAQRRFLFATRLRLIMLIIAGASGVVAIDGGPTSNLIGLIVAAAFVVALIAEFVILILRPERVWYEGRSAAESAKTLAWRYAVGGDPFPIAGPNSGETNQLFLNRLREILRDLRGLDLAPSAQGAEQITPQMRHLRARSLDERRSAYNIGRIEDQRRWYADRSAKDERAGRFWMTSMITIEVLGVVLGLLRATGVFRIDLLGLAATVAASIAAWLQAKQHQSQARAYFVAAQELAAIRSEIDERTTESQWATFVDEAEEAISREHVLWRASRSN